MAAGQGFKTFTTGEVLSASDVNGYLMQGVLVFASAAARDAAITSPQEGQFAYTKDTNGLWYYDGAAWVASGATGDIEGVTAGTGISGGGTSGTVTITNSMATAIDAKGDLVAGTGADAFARLGVGTNNQVLVADSAEATGLKWATPASGAADFTLLNAGGTNLTGANSITVSGISSKNTIMVLVVNASCASGGGNVSVRINNDASANAQFGMGNVAGYSSYNTYNIDAAGSDFTSTDFELGVLNSASSSLLHGFCKIDGAASANPKVVTFGGGGQYDSGSNHKAVVGGGIYRGAAVTSIAIRSGSGSNFDGGKVYIYTSA